MRFRTLLTTALALALGAIWWSGPASAVEKRSFWISDTAGYLDVCTVPTDDPQRAEAIHFCLAYMDGVVDYHDALSDHEDMKRLICYPETATLEQGVLVFIDWAQDNQGDKKLMGEPHVIGVVRALSEKWPCT